MAARWFTPLIWAAPEMTLEWQSALTWLGAAYVTGSTTSGDFPTSPTAYQTNLRGTQDAFVTKLKPDGSGIVYSTYLGGTGEETGRAIAVDFFLGYAYIAGDTNSSTSFPLSSAYQSSFGGGLERCLCDEIECRGQPTDLFDVPRRQRTATSAME